VQRVRCELTEEAIRDYARDQFLEPLILPLIQPKDVAPERRLPARPEIHQRAIEWLLGLHEDSSWLTAGDAWISAVKSEDEDLKRLVPAFELPSILAASRVSRSLYKEDTYQTVPLLAENVLGIRLALDRDKNLENIPDGYWWESEENPVGSIALAVVRGFERDVYRNAGKHWTHKGLPVEDCDAGKWQSMWTNGGKGDPENKDDTEQALNYHKDRIAGNRGRFDGEGLDGKLRAEAAELHQLYRERSCGTEQICLEDYENVTNLVHKEFKDVTSDVAIYFDLLYSGGLKPRAIRRVLGWSKKRLDAARNSANRLYRSLRKARKDSHLPVRYVSGGPSEYTFIEYLDVDGRKRRDVTSFSDRTTDGSPEGASGWGTILGQSRRLSQHIPVSQKFPDGPPRIDSARGMSIRWHRPTP
jgi:hypothetical protein